MPTIFEGAGVALITPFLEDGSVNYKKLEELIEEQISEGTDAIISCGTTGEVSTLTHDEQLTVIKETIKIVDKRVPVIAGTGSNCTETAVMLSKKAQSYGADGLLIVSPYYNKATQGGLIAHYTKIAENVDIPILLYNIPGRAGIALAPETIAYLVKNVKNIVGVKEAGGDISVTAKIFRLCRDTVIDVYSGNDDQNVAIMALGGKGAISVLSNIAPKKTSIMCHEVIDGNIKEAARLQLEALDVINNLFIEVNPIPVKAAMNLLGKEVGKLRLPLTYMEKEHLSILEESMKEYGLL